VEDVRAPPEKKNLQAIQQINSTLAIARLRIPPILFKNDDFKAIVPTQDNPMVITVEVITLSS